MSNTQSLRQTNIIDAKKASGSLTTQFHYDRVATFNKLNPLQDRSHLLP
jgi:hypothetical protein